MSEPDERSNPSPPSRPSSTPTQEEVEFGAEVTSLQVCAEGPTEGAVVLSFWLTLVDMNGVDKIIETSVSITQYRSTTPQSTASKMIIKLNELSKTV